MLKPLRLRLTRKTLNILYKSLVRSCLEYADVVWDGCNETDSDLLKQLQYEAARLVTGAIKGTSRESLLNEVAWVKLKETRSYHKLKMIYKIFNNLAPSYLLQLCPVQVIGLYLPTVSAPEMIIIFRMQGLNALKNPFLFLQ